MKEEEEEVRQVKEEEEEVKAGEQIARIDGDAPLLHPPPFIHCAAMHLLAPQSGAHS